MKNISVNFIKPKHIVDNLDNFEKLKAKIINYITKHSYLTISILFFTFITATAIWPEWWNATTDHLKVGAPKDTIANYIIYRNIGLFLAGFIGVGLAFWRSKSLSRQATVAEQGHITERIIRASEQLGSPEIHVRIGAIYTLWRTATDTNLEADKVMILDMLCAYVRSPTENHVNENSLSLKDNYGKIRKKNTEEKIRDDVQICLNLLCKKIIELDLSSLYCCNFQNSFLKNYNLGGADLRGAYLMGADLGGADLRRANLIKADLGGADLGGADLKGAYLIKADLAGTDFGGANLKWANLKGADLEGANLKGADLRGAELRGADLRGADLNRADLKEAKLWGAKLWGTKLGGADLWSMNINFTTIKEIKEIKLNPNQQDILGLTAYKHIMSNTK
ncbi:pentapeptide repeat-containing protein [Maridesulfovibrio sp.]|uniref:pentapeptide repeat-containing protein n=1 Tax=Maridesulfovibrio sp. TaxID=2795000 RepID=UPI002A189896|nr:pentapeptide repeat-containing protein [Maridesulfovibrio sp.]